MARTKPRPPPQPPAIFHLKPTSLHFILAKRPNNTYIVHECDGEEEKSGKRAKNYGMCKGGIVMTVSRIQARCMAVVVCFQFLCFDMTAFGVTPFNGYLFYGMDMNTTCYLKDMKGTAIHTWKNSYQITDKAYLLRDSSVLWPCTDNMDNGNGVWNPPTQIVETSGRFQIIKWDGTVAWDFPYHGAKFMPHHDCYPFYYTNDPKELPTIFAVVATLEADSTVAEKIVEIKPTGKNTADIKWEWRAYDHMTTNGTDKPELLDINKGGGMFGSSGGGFFGGDSAAGGKGKEWLHANMVRYNPILDQVLVSLKSINELIIIDHSTTTAQAATHSGGQYGKGGDILYRWGNPSSYGIAGTQYFEGQHSVVWIPQYMPGTRKPLPGAGNILVVSNGNQKGYEIQIPNNAGVYSRTAGKAFEPAAPLRTFSLPNMGSSEGVLQRLPGGITYVFNSYMMSGAACLEYDSAWTSIWSLKGINAYQCFLYDSTYMGSTLGEFTEVIDKHNVRQAIAPSKPEYLRENGALRVFFDRGAQSAKIDVYSADGRNIFNATVAGNEFTLDLKNRAPGVYFISVRTNGFQRKDRVVVSKPF
jgi:hypothetical protein